MKLKLKELSIIWYFFKPYKLKLLYVFSIMIMNGLLMFANLAALYPVINYGLNLQNKNFIIQSFSYLNTFFHVSNLFLLSCIILLIISAISTLVNIFYQYSSYKLMMHIVKNIQAHIFKQFKKADFYFYINNQQGKLIHTGTIAPASAANLVLFTLRFSNDFITTIALIGLLFSLTAQGTILLISLGVIYTFSIKKIINLIIYKSADISTIEKKKKNVILNEFLSGIKIIKVFYSQDLWEKKFLNAVNLSLLHQFKMLMGRVYPEAIMRFIYFGMIGGVGIIISQKTSQEFITVLPMFGTFAIVANRFLPALQKLGNSLMAAVNSLPNTKNVFNLLTLDINKVKDGSLSISSFNNNITFKNVSFTYPSSSKPVLTNINFSIEKNQMTALVGESGSGKSTIINLILKLYAPLTGTIEIDNNNIFSLQNKNYLSHIGYVSQESFIFNSSIKDNIAFNDSSYTDEDIINASKLANAHDFIIETEQGYDTIVGDSGLKLSGGQRQRLSIARAIIRKPEILIFDEATSSLDNIAEKKVQEAINNISQHTTILVIAHRLSTIENANKIIVLKNGQIQETGTHTELIKDHNSFYFNLYTQQQTN